MRDSSGAYFVVFNTGDVKFVIGFWFWGFERACQNSEFRVFNLLGHLRVAEVFVDNNTSDQLSIIELSSDLKFLFKYIRKEGRTLVSILMSSKLTSFFSKSATARTASTAMSAN